MVGQRKNKLALTFVALAASALVTLTSLVALPAAPASADTVPVEGQPSTVSSDALPTVQINGIVWDQVVIGNTVFAGGQFTSARPAGAAAGTSETPRSHLLAYDLVTGELIASFAPTLDAQVRSLAASPDGTRLYVAGDFTTVNGVTRNRVAAFDLPSRTLAPDFAPSANAAVWDITATDSVVYAVGNFGRMASNDRAGAAAIARSGALLPWAPVLDGRGSAVAVSGDGLKVVVGGAFATVNGSGNPGRGMAMVDGATGASLPFGANTAVRNSGENGGITSLKSDGDSVYGSGYTYGRDGGTLEGMFRASWSTGELEWVTGCHGDTYDIEPVGDVIYGAGHAHFCDDLVGGFSQSDPWSYYRGIAVTKSAARVTPTGIGSYGGYTDFGGNSAPEMLHWMPQFDTGTVSGATQGPWTVESSAKYVVYGGEFTRVNNTPQQGLVRFAVRDTAPNTDGPRLQGSNYTPTATAVDGGHLRISWPVNYDRDNEYLTYRVIRDGVNASPIHEVTARSKPADWAVPGLTYLDTGVAPGSTHTYRIRVQDPTGNVGWSAIISATAPAATPTASAYRSEVLSDSPLHYWPLDESTSQPGYDWKAARDFSLTSAVTRGVAGAVTGEPRTAARFNGGTNAFGATSTLTPAPQTFALETWFRTSSSSPGKILGFGNRATGNSTTQDRSLYMNSSGRLLFGVQMGTAASGQRIITSDLSYNDGQWHHVVANMGATGMELFVDGARIGSRTDIDISATALRYYMGYWRLGGDATWSGNQRFTGDLDEVAIYAAPLDRAAVASHYLASGRTLAGGVAPADAYGAMVWDKYPSLYWRLDDTTGTAASDVSGQGSHGTYLGTVTKGASGAIAGVANSAVTFSGGRAYSQRSFTGPQVYSAEAWIRTTSTTGGKVVGFGNTQTGNSATYDRHVFLRNDGRLTFDVLSASSGTARASLTTAAAVNDGQWHHVVATQSATGMKLYVDGVQAGENTQASARSYTGYWRVGHDVTPSTSSSSAFNGTIDEVAIYPVALTAADVALHNSVGRTGLLPNVLPTASFTATPTYLSVGADASASVDSDGTIQAYDWNWGDGTPGSTGALASHVYATAGTYIVTLSVTDDRGGVSTTTRSVVVVANVAPTAAFTASASGLTGQVDASTSSDPDGSIASYSWSWGDGTPDGSGATATHAYAAAGTYDVVLTVTDQGGATASTTRSLSVTVPVGAVTYATDSFARTSASGWGTADQGGAWTHTSSASNYTIAASVARMSQPSGGSVRSGYLNSVSSSDTAVVVDITLPSLPTGGSVFATAIPRRVGAEEYRARVVVTATGATSIQLQRTNTTVLTVPAGITVAAGETITLRAEATGTSPTTVRAKVWKAGTAEPTDWTASTSDSFAALQVAGSVGLMSYIGSTVTNLPYPTVFDNLWAGSTARGPEPEPNIAPTAAFSHTATHLALAVDASSSTDTDGVVSSYSWSWGDGTPVGTGVTATHAYASAGTYEVTLTVTDDDAATGTTSQTITVTAEPEPEIVLPFALDEFATAAASGLGTAATGGAWTVTSSATNYAVADGSARFRSPAAGSLRNGYLVDAVSASSDVLVTAALPALPTNASAFVSAIGRRVGTEDYRARFVVSPTGTVQLQIQRTSTTLTVVNVPGVTVAAGEALNLRVETTGTGTTTIRAKVWKAGTTEPVAWQTTATDTTAALQAPGHVGIATYTGSGLSNLPFDVLFDRFEAKPVVTP